MNILMLANAWHSEAEQCFTRSGQASSSLETDSEYKNNIGFYATIFKDFMRS